MHQGKRSNGEHEITNSTRDVSVFVNSVIILTVYSFCVSLNIIILLAYLRSQKMRYVRNLLFRGKYWWKKRELDFKPIPWHSKNFKRFLICSQSFDIFNEFSFLLRASQFWPDQDFRPVVLDESGDNLLFPILESPSHYSICLQNISNILFFEWAAFLFYLFFCHGLFTFIVEYIFDN